MFDLFKPKLPISEEQRVWMDESFAKLATLLGRERMLNAAVMLPTPAHFPDFYDGSESALYAMLGRVAVAMDLDPDQIDVRLFVDEEDTTRGLSPLVAGVSSGAGGLYFHTSDSRAQIAVNENKLEDPLALVATLAQELGHIILLRPGLVDPDAEDMEPLNDLLTVFLGFGVFNANAAFQFHQYTNNETQGWSMQRLGYLSEPMFGYALALFAHERGESKPAWASFLATNIAAHFKQSSAWLKARGTGRVS